MPVTAEGTRGLGEGTATALLLEELELLRR